MKIEITEIRNHYGMILYYFPYGIDWEDFLGIDEKGGKCSGIQDAILAEELGYIKN